MNKDRLIPIKAEVLQLVKRAIENKEIIFTQIFLGCKEPCPMLKQKFFFMRKDILTIAINCAIIT